MLRVQQLAAKDATSDKGFAMLVTAVITILLFSLLGAYLTMTDLSKSAASAYVDGSNTFYAAESGLNQRASIVRDRFDGYTVPSGSSPGQVAGAITPARNIANCFNSTLNQGSGDFKCKERDFKSTSSGNIRYEIPNGTNGEASNSYTTTRQTDTYVAYSFVADTTQYATDPITGAPTINPVPKVVPQGEDYAGLNVIEYKYTVYATAAKQNSSTSVTNADAKTVLQMDFKSRTIPLFQFAAFYDGDLEMHSGTAMNISGRVHTNRNLYVQPNGNNITTFTNNITAVGGVFRRVDVAIGANTSGPARLELTPPIGATPGTYLNFPPSDYTMATPINLAATTIGTTSGERTLSAADSIIFRNRVKDGNSGIVSLAVPSAGFLRKRNYYKSATAVSSIEKQAAVGEYWAKADIRLEMVPDRDAVTAAGASLTPTQLTDPGRRLNIPAWGRNEAIIPFNFTSIQAGTTPSNCTTTPPVAGIDPDPLYVDATRNGVATLQCNVFTKGQLQSLRQPVMVLTAINQPDRSIDHTDRTVAGSESKTLLKPLLPAAPAITATDGTKTKILRALQVAIASNPIPLAVDSLNVKFNNVTTYPPANGFKTEFTRLLALITELSVDDQATLLTSSPSEIAALQQAWFLPAPIQRLASNVDPTGRANRNIRSSGFYDSRERRWITMLQTNIKSLTVWNRDGLYVEADDVNLRAPYSAAAANKNAAFNSGTGANFTDGRAFVRAVADSTQVLEPDNLGTANQLANFLRLGLGSTNRTEGGLVFHATVSDDLNGDGTSTDVSTVNDVNCGTNVDCLTTRTANPSIPYQTEVDGSIRYQKKADGTFKRDSSGYRVPFTLDYFRQYWGGVQRRSPFGFAFNGGDFLPGAMSITTDQSIYIQGDFNNNSKRQTAIGDPTITPPNPFRLPAAIMADTITILSNECVAGSSARSVTNHLGVIPGQIGILAGQIRCGLPREANGAIDLGADGNRRNYAGGNLANFYGVTGSTAVNAAFLSYTDRSNGNCNNLTGTYVCGPAAGTSVALSGGLNNYIRMLEDWGVTGNAQYFNYSGSFVSLGTPLEYSGIWVNNFDLTTRARITGNGISSGTTTSRDTNAYYNIPSRNYNFDPNFTSFDRLPPMTPRVQYLQQEVFKRTFN